jgi:hypothetical protein
MTGCSSDPPGSDLAKLLEEFRSLSLLLPLVTGISHQGHPTFKDLKQDHLKPSQPPPDIALNSIASLLVRNFEVVAAATQSTPCENEFNILAMLLGSDSDLDLDLELPNGSRVKSFSFSTIANPDTKDRHYDLAHPYCVYSNKGESHWHKMLTDNQYYLNIP